MLSTNFEFLSNSQAQLIFLLASRLSLVIYGTWSKRTLIKRARAVKQAAQDDPNAVEYEDDEGESYHLFPKTMFPDDAKGPIMTKVRRDLLLTQVDVKFDEILFDTEFISCNLAATNELNGISGALALGPVSMLVAFIKGEGPTGYYDLLSSGNTSNLVFIFLGVCALQYYLHPTCAYKFVYQYNSTVPYIIMRCFILMCAGVASVMYLETATAGAFKTVGIILILAGLIFYRLAGQAADGERQHQANVEALKVTFKHEIKDELLESDREELEEVRKALGTDAFNRVIFETALRLNKEAWSKPRMFVKCDAYEHFYPPTKDIHDNNEGDLEGGEKFKGLGAASR